ncbi:threonine synthase [Pseudogracilibacillus sp. SE30717A]|uniref:threonine synthase n=1 Tax=Pseudogracilibacillus sp. SE30717A TaxID=3098293 RepID=UPI00300DF742
MRLKCIECSEHFEVKPLYKCPNCNGILDVVYDVKNEKLRDLTSSNDLKQTFIFHDHKTDNLLGEGNTPIVSLSKTARRVHTGNLYAKCEFLNPSGSFKDRPVAAGIKKALEFGYEKIIVASSGNGAASVSAFAARFGLDCIILVPESTPDEKVKQAHFYGGKVIKVKGPYSNSFNLALRLSEVSPYYNLTTTFINPYTIEGDKGVAYEAHFQLNQWPDYVVVPIGAGPLLVGTFKGFKELKELFDLDCPLPRMIGVQATGCSPIAEAFKLGLEYVSEEENPQTIAGGIGDGLLGYSEDGTYTLDIIRESGGLCIDVSDGELLAAQSELAKEEGMFVEPSAATSLAGWRKAFKGKDMTETSSLLLMTGHGLKDMKSIDQTNEIIPCILPNVDDLIRLIQK